MATSYYRMPVIHPLHDIEVPEHIEFPERWGRPSTITITRLVGAWGLTVAIELEGFDGLDGALSEFARRAREHAMGQLEKTGEAIGNSAARSNQTLYGPMHLKPTVRRKDDTVRVGYARIRPRSRKIATKHLERAKRDEWPGTSKR